MFKKSAFITVSLLSLLVSACSVDQSYRREINDNDDYLNSPPLRQLVAPAGITLPVENTDYYIYTSSRTNGATGKDMDIRVPSQPLATLPDSYASYQNGVATLEIGSSYPLWDEVRAFLASKNIAIASSDGTTIQTGPYLFTRPDEAISYETRYLIHYTKSSVRQFLKIELLSLTKLGQEVNGPIESQRYTVDFFNMMMLELKKREMSANRVPLVTN